jgi:hypothetical protein
MNEWTGTVNTLGQDSYPDEFAGAVLANGQEDLYVVANATTFLNVVAASDTQGLPYKVITVPRSYQALTDLMGRITSDSTTLRAEGVALSGWGTDPASDSVQVTLQAPTASDLSTFAATTGTTVAPTISAPPAVDAQTGATITPATYTGAVGDYLTQMFGAGVTVAASTTGPASQDDWLATGWSHPSGK